ncbi:uncharacterized protein EURHEDRAFT_46710 [Aspergillus ruber CBS 135680]|uniref:Uncharacterized protein n=1 Tax=Aspergillus ruber (strain CBS 135680) TaxID=1388766 RepID=A0A017SH35_ASPRC|nr:uncharacterized protein EURHEDRAFT_46710 [Aspergillus ruber CBS 135680]EYE95580.1 hypothetical protein EURHEDRAFT_46710 [Aspergillus ruber CBS 135680]
MKWLAQLKDMWPYAPTEYSAEVTEHLSLIIPGGFSRWTDEHLPLHHTYIKRTYLAYNYLPNMLRSFHYFFTHHTDRACVIGCCVDGSLFEPQSSCHFRIHAYAWAICPVDLYREFDKPIEALCTLYNLIFGKASIYSFLSPYGDMTEGCLSS